MPLGQAILQQSGSRASKIPLFSNILTIYIYLFYSVSILAQGTVCHMLSISPAWGWAASAFLIGLSLATFLLAFQATVFFVLPLASAARTGPQGSTQYRTASLSFIHFSLQPCPQIVAMGREETRQPVAKCLRRVTAQAKKPKLTTCSAEQLAEITNSTEFQTALAAQISATIQTSLTNLLPLQLAPALAQQTKEMQAMLDHQDKSLDARFNGLRASVTPVQDDATLARLSEVCDRFSAIEQKANSGSSPSQPADIQALVDKAVGERLAASPSASAAAPVSAAEIAKQVDEAVQQKLAGMSLAPSPDGSVVDGSTTPRLGAWAKPLVFSTPPTSGQMGATPQRCSQLRVSGPPVGSLLRSAPLSVWHSEWLGHPRLLSVPSGT